MRVDFQIVCQKDMNPEISLRKEKAKDFDFISFEDNEMEIFIKGILINQQDLRTEYAFSGELGLLIKRIFNQRGNLFSDALIGEFCGFLFDKISNKIYVFTNLIGSQRVFYYAKNGIVAVDTNLFSLKEYLDQNKLPNSEDLNSAYSLLTLSNLLDNDTLIQEVKKLRSSEQIVIDVSSNNFKVETIAPLEGGESFHESKAAALQKLDELFATAVRQEYETDVWVGKNHFALLSGGLDSRLGIFYAMQQNFENIDALCFSNSGYWDEKIARQIAEDYDINLNVVSLNTGSYLTEIDELTDITQGLAQFTGGVHSNYALKKMDFSNSGILHSGHLGDAVLGSYLSAPNVQPPQNSISKIVAHSNLRFKIEDHIQQVANQYESEELFLLHNRGFNFIAVGAYVAEKFSWQVSPFMHNDFLRFVLQLPPKWKYNQELYIEWINKYAKASTKYTWERTLMKPDKKWKTQFGTAVFTRLNNIYYNKLLGKPYKSQMASYQFNYESQIEIKQYFDNYFEENISKLKNEELRKDAENMFLNGNFKEKMMVLTLLGAYKKLFS